MQFRDNLRLLEIGDVKMNFVVDDDQDSRVDTSTNPYLKGTFHDVMNLV